MSNVTFRGYKVTECTFVNKHDNGQKVEFQNSYNYSVKYDAVNNVCIGEIELSLKDKDAPDKFYVKLSITGIFDYNTNAAKEVIHVETFKELFPFARAVVSTVTTAAGVPPVFIPPLDIESQSIYKVEKNI